MTRLRWLALLFLVACSGAGAKPIYLDVRTPAEFAAGHIDGAINIPHDDIERRWRELEPRRAERIVVYCRSGRRSALASAVLRANGFTRIDDAGPMRNLVAAGARVAP